MPDCLICNGETKFYFSARDYARTYDGTERQLFWCSRCDFGRLEGDFDPTEVSTFYPNDYYTHDFSGNVPKQEPSFSQRLRTHLAWRFDRGSDLHPNEIDKRGGTVCDIGSGDGGVLRLWKEAGYRTYGIEPDPIARLAAASFGDIYDGTAENLPREVLGRKFDVVQMKHVLEHCIDPSAAIENAKKILAKDGTLIIEVPNNAALGFSTFQELWPWADIPRHLNFFTDTSLHLLLQNSGLTIYRTIYTGYTRQFSPNWVAKQSEIWGAIKKDRAPNFELAAWLLLLRTVLSKNRRKYDSIRVHVQHLQSIVSVPSL